MYVCMLYVKLCMEMYVCVIYTVYYKNVYFYSGGREDALCSRHLSSRYTIPSGFSGAAKGDFGVKPPNWLRQKEIFQVEMLHF